MAILAVGAALVAFRVVLQADPTGVPSWVTSISDLGIVVFLIIVFFGGLREKPWWVPGSSHRTEVQACEFRTAAAEKDRDYYRDALFRALGASERAVETTRTLAQHALGTDVTDNALRQEMERRGLKP